MVVCLQRNRKIMLFLLQTSIQQRVRTDARGWVRVVYYIMWWCSSFAGEEDHDFESLGGGVGAEMAEGPNLHAEVSVAMGSGDAGGWTRLGIWTPFLSSLANLIFLTDAVVFEGQHSRSHKWAPCRTVYSTRFPCGVGNVTALERLCDTWYQTFKWVNVV